MPSPTHRTQVLLSSAIQAKVMRLAAKKRRSMSAMCAELIEYAISHGEDFKEIDDTKANSRTEALIQAIDALQKLLKEAEV